MLLDIGLGSTQLALHIKAHHEYLQLLSRYFSQLLKIGDLFNAGHKWPEIDHVNGVVLFLKQWLKLLEVYYRHVGFASFTFREEEKGQCQEQDACYQLTHLIHVDALLRAVTLTVEQHLHDSCSSLAG